MSSPNADYLQLTGKVCLVTGGSRGMGECTVRRFAAEGATVIAADILDDEGKALAAELGDSAAKGSVRYVHLDVSQEAGWVELIAEIERDFGRLDVLVNNAGILRFAAVTDIDADEMQQILGINLFGVTFGMKHAIPLMKRGGGGSIVNLSSTEGLGGTLFCGAYTASKFAVRGITKVAAIENGKEGVRVNSVHPGGIDTPMTRAVVDDDGRKYIASKVSGLKRMGTADEVAKLIVFLASDASSYCTGAEFVVDGGATASAGF
jgi:3alpha(or 20beta)-hydroxysteroid dehydrogenase